MAISVREVLSSGSNTNGTNCTATTGAGTAIGDVIYVIHMDDFYTAAAMTAPTATGVTFTQQGATVDMGSNFEHAKVWSTTAVANGALTITCHSTQTDQERYMVTYVLTGANATADVVGAGGSTSNQTALSIPSISPTGTTDLLIAAWEATENTAGTLTAFTNGMTQQGSSTNISNVAICATASKTLSASGATGACSCTLGPGGSHWAGVLVAVSASGAAPFVAAPPLIVDQAVMRAAYR